MATNAAVTTTDSPSAMGTLITTPINPDEPPNACSAHGTTKYSGMRNSTWRVSSKTAALNGCPLDWK